MLTRMHLIVITLASFVGGANCHELSPVDINQYPWSSIGKLYNRAGEACSGVIISPVEVATAAHCLYNARTGMLLHPESLHFLLGYNQGDYREDLHVSDFSIGPNYVFANRTVAAETSDWAKLRLEKPAPDRFRPIPPADKSAQIGDRIMVAGFAQTRQYSMTADTGCTVRGVLVAGLIVHDCAVLNGDSGGPILIRVGETVEVLGIHVAQAIVGGTAIQIAVPISNLVASQK